MNALERMGKLALAQAAIGEAIKAMDEGKHHLAAVGLMDNQPAQVTFVGVALELLNEVSDSLPRDSAASFGYKAGVTTAAGNVGLANRPVGNVVSGEQRSPVMRDSASVPPHDFGYKAGVKDA